MKKHSSMFLLLLSCFTICHGQQRFVNLGQALKQGRLLVGDHHQAIAIDDDGKQAISCNGIVWLKGENFSTGTIDVDIKGKDVFQQSFLGIAFHGVDTVTFDAVYFRPFNFRADDKLRKVHQVQYIAEPAYGWEKLRNEHPGVYENSVTPALNPAEWFHAHIVVSADEITVYVNQNTGPSLKVKKLNNRTDGRIGLWTFGLNGEFANLTIRR